MKKNLIAAAAALSVLIAAPAMAGELAAGGYAVGPYVGAQIGFGGLDTGYRAANGATVGDVSASGVTGGAFAGYSAVFGKFVVGPELEANFTNASGSIVASGGNRTRFDLQDSYIASIRTGYLFAPATQAYVKNGLSYARVTVKDGVQGKDANWLPGYALGAGVEHMVSQTVSVRGEYVHTFYQSQNLYGTNSSISPETNEVRAGVALHF